MDVPQVSYAGGDQPNRRIRTRTYGGVVGGSCEAPPYHGRAFFVLLKEFILHYLRIALIHVLFR